MWYVCNKSEYICVGIRVVCVFGYRVVFICGLTALFLYVVSGCLCAWVWYQYFIFIYLWCFCLLCVLAYVWCLCLCMCEYVSVLVLLFTRIMYVLVFRGCVVCVFVFGCCYFCLCAWFVCL